MGGFSSVVGFLFSFVIIAGAMTTSFLYVVDDTLEKSDLINDNYQLVKESKTSFLVDELYYNSNRLSFSVINNGNENIILKEQLNDCFDVFIDGTYISKDKLEHYLLNPAGDYYVLFPGRSSTIDLQFNLNQSKDHDIKIVDCNGQTYEYQIDATHENWFMDSYKRRSQFTVFNVLAANFENTYYDIELNSTNFDFTKGTEDTISVMLPVDENIVLSLNFDTYSQQLNEYSRYSNTAYLGAGVGVGIDDPSSTKQSVFFNALNFDGTDDRVRILSDTTLELDKSMTISAWVKWNANGDNEQTIFLNGDVDNKVSIINDAGVNDDKLLYSLSIGATPRTLYSNTKIDDNWHHLALTYNGSVMKMYIDSIEESQLAISADIDTQLTDNFIGSNQVGNFFNGTIDDFKLFNIALNQSDIDELYQNKLNFKNLNYTVGIWDKVAESANISVKIPYIRGNDNISFDIYYYENGDTFGEEEIIIPPSPTPSAVSDLAASRGNNDSVLTWTAPFDGGSPITSYVIKYGTVASGLFDNTYIDDATPGATIINLTNDVEWQFRVYAVNANGDGSLSNIATTTPTAMFYFTQDLVTNLGIDGAANQGTTPIGLAQMIRDPSVVASACVGVRTTMVNYILAQEYTEIYDRQMEIVPSIKGSISVDGSTSPITYIATLYEYNDATGDVGAALGTAQNLSTVAAAETLSLTFNNAAFNVTSGNRLKVVIDATNGGNKISSVCYGTGTQSSFEFARNSFN